jgi:DNA-binding PadR family transcriptional regulator
MPESRFTARKGNRGQKAGSLTTADLIVLSLLAEHAMHGYQLLAEYERQEVADWASVSKAQVYYAIQKLARLELIEATEQRGAENDRDRTVYTPTPQGQKELIASLVGVEWARTRVPQPFATWLGLSIHIAPDAANNVLNARRTFLEEELERERTSLQFIRTLTSARAKAGEAVVRLVIRQIEVEIEWIANLSNV